MRSGEKKTKIMELAAIHKAKRSDWATHIAGLVGTTVSYVYTVVNQRKGAGQSEYDKRYLTSSLRLNTWKDYYARNKKRIAARGVIYRKGRYRKACEKNYAAVAARRAEYYWRHRDARLAYQRRYDATKMGLDKSTE